MHIKMLKRPNIWNNNHLYLIGNWKRMKKTKSIWKYPIILLRVYT